MEYVIPEYEVTVGSSFFNAIKKKEKDTITYEDDVLEIPVIKELGLTRTMSELEIYASGIIFDYINQTAGAEIALKAVILPPELINMLEGAKEKEGFTINKTNDIGREFAFGYWGENSDGSFVYYWHPVCKLVPADEKHKTRTKDIPDPEADYKIKIIPYNGVWRVKYSTKAAVAEGLTPLTKDEFFAKPIYSEAQIPVTPTP